MNETTATPSRKPLYFVVIFGALTALFMFLFVTAEIGGKAAPFLLGAVTLIGLLIALLVLGFQFVINMPARSRGRGSSNRERNAADEIRAKLPSALVDYYSPKAAFHFNRPSRSEFATPQLYDTAVKQVQADELKARVENADKYVLDVKLNTDDDRIVDVLLATREGTTDEALVHQAPMLNAYLKTFGIDEWDADPRAGYVGLRINTAYVPSPLEVLSANTIDAKEFFTENPAIKDDVANDVFSIPMGKDARGNTWNHPLHHSICTARTGGGKESHLQSFIYQMMPAIASGHVRVWICDPKPSAALPYMKNSVMHRVAIDDEDIVDVIAEFFDEMSRQREREDLGESNAVTVENPVNILVLDEASDFLDDVISKWKDEEGRTSFGKLKAITRKGRSLNFFLMAYSQEITADPMKGLPKNIPTKLSGYMESAYEVSKSLNVTEDYVKTSKSIIFPIPESNRQNGMKYAGIFNVVRDDERLAVRLPFVSRQLIEERVREFGLDAPRNQQRQHTPTPSAPIFAPAAQVNDYYEDDLGKEVEDEPETFASFDMFDEDE
jgi:hypothetical protein